MARTKQAVSILYNSFKAIREFPRSDNYAHKTIICEGKVKVYGTKYYRRDFSDGSSELVRYDFDSGKWVFLLFKGDAEVETKTTA